MSHTPVDRLYLCGVTSIVVPAPHGFPHIIALYGERRGKDVSPSAQLIIKQDPPFEFFGKCDVLRIASSVHESRLDGLHPQFSNANLREQAVHG